GHGARAAARAPADVLLGLLGEVAARRAAGELGPCELPGPPELHAEYGLLNKDKAAGELARAELAGADQAGTGRAVLAAAVPGSAGLRGLPLYATGAAGAPGPAEPRRRPWSPQSS